MNYWLIVMAQVTGKKDSPARFIVAGVINVNQHQAGTEDVPGNAKLGMDALRDCYRFACIGHGSNQLQGFLSITLGVKRQRGLVFCEAMAIAVIGIFFL